MGKFRVGRERGQITFLPRSLEEYVSKDDPVRFIDALVDEFNLGCIEREYSMLGRPAFSPRVLTKIVVYGKVRGIRSCRELARAARENVKFMYIANDEKPDFRTINLFRKRFHKELSTLLAQTVHIALREGMITLEHVAIDSTKVRGYASKKSFKKPKEVEGLIKELTLEIEASLCRDIEEDASIQDDEMRLPAELQSKERLRDKAKEALRVYGSMTESGTRKKAPKEVSLSDPECRYLPERGGKVTTRSYNMQAAVDKDSRIVLAGYATNCNDNSQIIPMVEEIEKNTGNKQIKELSADRGYSEHKALGKLKEKGIVGFIPLTESYDKSLFSNKDFVYDESSDTLECPAKRRLCPVRYNSDRSERVYKCKSCSDCPLKARCLRNKDGKCRTIRVSKYRKEVEEMLLRVKSDVGKSRKMLRAMLIETLFGHIKHARNLLRWSVRGLSMVNAMWSLELTAVNIEKIIKYRMKKQAAAAAA